ncbi:alpha-ketoglutarate-dependent dioxygenase alkB homolog 7, mitochondrial isoform X3 [Pan paniscus]|uniref:alpha-ketoglutarate-dependent dioxygenase alkB homolog 7, mitochondrial isoform X3 n=1 Tax=Pan troglodytes TaxID=9598 RepID=UPI0007DBC673|nr:alpha-ketoglutarate-dependent dioxygenase alkB homolog 7, mitochondrial isoform X3 [Pan troglodytes]XP_034800258.1 alpha-ketoglutarate-dependent dioxygenase alkB homolog 7, mitochondrial isoform X3 [Pan paniscus]
MWSQMMLRDRDRTLGWGQVVGRFSQLNAGAGPALGTWNCSLRFPCSLWELPGLTELTVQAIHGFRETEKSRWSEASRAILQRVQAAAFGPGQTLLSSVHVLDLEARGYIKPHVDSIKFCGATIAGLSLLSPSVMRLVHTQEPGEWLELLLEPGSLYILRGSARYDFSHEILRDEESFFGERRIPRGRRISVICRSLPEGMGPGESGQPPPAC